MSREIDARLAEVMGISSLKLCASPEFCEFMTDFPVCPIGGCSGDWTTCEHGLSSADPYSASLDLMTEVEREIERRKLRDKYIWEISALVGSACYEPNVEDVWAMLTAPASVRAQAALRVLEGRG
jgi:hypothetical protein